MNVLVACEESQRVCAAFRERGHNAFSCDIQECSGGRPEWHIHGDVFRAIYRNESGMWEFFTTDNAIHCVKHWDLLIAHPPCTFLTVSGNRWFNVDKYGESAILRKQKQIDAIKFFMAFTEFPAERIAIENPVGIMSTEYRKPDQIIHPWQFGHPEQKKTCLWLKGLPHLVETNNVYEYMMTLPIKERTRIWQMGGGHSRERSKTFPGIASAMAEQWGTEV